jgi:hypothetical protein
MNGIYLKRIIPTPPLYAAESFVMKVDTTKAGSASDTFVLPLRGAGYNITIKWGDGTSTDYVGGTANVNHNITKVYAASGEYIVEVIRNTPTGFPTIYFNNSGDRLKLMDVLQVGLGTWATMAFSFFGCVNLTWSATDKVVIGVGGNLEETFRNCSEFNGAIGNWDVSNVLVFFRTFIFCPKFNQDLSEWDVAKSTNNGAMFFGATIFNHNISGWDTQKANRLDFMFRDSGYKHPLMIDYRALTDGANFVQNRNINTTGSTANYDATLEHIRKHLDTVFSGESAVRGLQSGVTINFGNSKFSAAGQADKAAIVAAKGWIFTDGGLQT